MATPQLLTKREASSRARLCVESLNKLIRSGEGPAVTVLGSKVLIDEAELGAWIKSRTVPSHMVAA
ncbi:MAG: helix-turn-helix domain-containing protein [Janthinobacterium lividum]